jgi:hypothetical protein
MITNIIENMLDDQKHEKSLQYEMLLELQNSKPGSLSEIKTVLGFFVVDTVSTREQVAETADMFT